MRSTPMRLLSSSASAALSVCSTPGVPARSRSSMSAMKSWSTVLTYATVPPPPTLGGSSRLYRRSLKTSTPLDPGPPRNLCGEMNTASSDASPSPGRAGGFMSISTYGALAAKSKHA